MSIIGISRHALQDHPERLLRIFGNVRRRAVRTRIARGASQGVSISQEEAKRHGVWTWFERGVRFVLDPNGKVVYVVKCGVVITLLPITAVLFFS